MITIDELLEESGLELDNLLLIVDAANPEKTTVVEEREDGTTRDIPIHLCFKLLNRTDADQLDSGEYRVSELLAVTTPTR